MRSAKIFLIFFTYFLLLLTCEYSPTGSNYQHKEIPEPILYIDLNSSTDTIAVWGQATLAYNLDLLGRRFYEGEILLGNVRIHSFNQPIGYHSFNTDDYISDTLSLIIKGYSSSGSNSLADLAGIEYLYFEREYTLIVDNRPPEPLSIVDISTESGDLVITWGKFEGNGFVRYNIYKGQPQSGGYINEQYLSSSFNENQTSLIDTTYLGGPAYYRVDIISELGASEGAFILHDEPKPQFYTSSDTNYIGIPLTWSPCKYPQNFSRYDILVESEVIFSTEIINDTSFFDTGRWFGDAIEYTLDVVLKDNYLWYNNTHDYIEVFLGEPFPHPGRLQFHANSGSIYRQIGLSLYRLDSESYEDLDSIDVASDASYFCFGISPNGQFAYIMNYENDIGYLHKVDPLTFSIEETWTTHSLLGYNGRGMDDISVSNNNLIAFASFMDNNNSNWGRGIVVMDLNEPIQVVNPNYSSGTSAQISENGFHVLAYDSLYNYTNGSLVWRANLGIGSESMFIDNGTRFVVISNDEINVYNSANLSFVTQISTSERLRSVTYDPVSGYIGGVMRLSHRYMIYNPLAGETIYDIYVNGSRFKLWNNTIYASPYLLPLSYLGY